MFGSWLRSRKTTQEEKGKSKAALQPVTVEKIYINLSNPFTLPPFEKQLLFMLLTDPEKKTLPKFSKQDAHTVTYNVLNDGQKTVSLTLSHSLRKVEREQLTTFEIIGKGKDKENVLGQGSFGKVQKSLYLLVLTDRKIKFFKEIRADKKQVIRKVDEKPSKFTKRINAEYRASKSLYYLDSVGEPVLYSDRKKQLICHTSFPYFGISLDQIDISKLPIGDLLNLLVGLFIQVDHFHHQGFAHRDIKPANTAYDERKARLTLLDTGLAIIKGQEKSLGGTAGYIHRSFAKEVMAKERKITLQEAQKLDVYALALTTAVMLGLPENYTKECVQKKRPCNFHLLQCRHPIQTSLEALLKKMTNENFHELPTMDDCLEEIMEIQKTLYVNELERLEDRLSVAIHLIGQDLDTREKENDIKKPLFDPIYKKLLFLRQQVQEAKRFDTELIAKKGLHEIPGVTFTTIAADYNQFSRRIKRLATQLEDPAFEKEQGGRIRINIYNNLGKCCCLFSKPNSYYTAIKAREPLNLDKMGSPAYTI